MRNLDLDCLKGHLYEWYGVSFLKLKVERIEMVMIWIEDLIKTDSDFCDSNWEMCN